MLKKLRYILFLSIICFLVIFTIIFLNRPLNWNTKKENIINKITKEMSKSEVDDLLGTPIDEIGSGLHVYVYQVDTTIIYVSIGSHDKVVNSVIQNSDGTTTPIDLTGFSTDINLNNINDI